MTSKEQKNQVVEEFSVLHEDLSDPTGSEGSNVVIPPPQRKGIVQRCFHRKFTSKGQKKRATIFYEYDRENKIMLYAAVIIDLDAKMKKKPIEVFENSAKKRFRRAPVVVRNFKETGNCMQDLHDQIRKLLFEHGCKSKN